MKQLFAFVKKHLGETIVAVAVVIALAYYLYIAVNMLGWMIAGTTAAILLTLCLYEYIYHTKVEPEEE